MANKKGQAQGLPLLVWVKKFWLLRSAGESVGSGIGIVVLAPQHILTQLGAHGLHGMERPGSCAWS